MTNPFTPPAVGTALATAQVLAWRLPMLGLMMADPNPARQREAVRMVTEKQTAMVAGAFEAQAVLARAWLSMCLGDPRSVDPAAMARRMTHAASVPANRTV